MLFNRKIVYAQMIADGDMDMQTFKITNSANGMEIKKLRVQKEFLQESVSKDEVNLFSIKEDGTPRIYYTFQCPSAQVS